MTPECFSFFEGLTADELTQARAGLERRTFPARTTVLTQGVPGHELYIIESGSADVFVRDDQGRRSSRRARLPCPGGR